MSSEAIPLQRVLSQRLKEVRAPAMRQDDLAAAMRHYGFNWTAATVAAIETGRRDVSLEEATALPLALGCELSDLLLSRDHEKVSLNERRAILREAVAAIYVGEAGAIEEEKVRPLLPTLLPQPDEDAIHAMKVAGIRDEALLAVWIEQARRQDAERKAARSLDRSPSEVAAFGLRLWGRSLTEERDARLDSTDYVAASEQAIKGHITRELLTEMRSFIESLESLPGDWSPDELTGMEDYRDRMRHITVAKLREVVDEVTEYGERKRGNGEEPS